MDLAKELFDLEDRFWAAAGDRTFYDARLARNAVLLFPDPTGVLDRAQALDAAGAARPWSSWRIDDRRLVALSDQSAAIAYRAEARREGQPPYAALACSVYVREDGAWKLALHQQTPAG